ncbi:MAG: alpha/beta fold hydrolase [Planctomycetota bacterium]|nr:MAG: alpha/beta fold hydrolase [Planctomycetota bacterium]REJ92586.1 MAG: alpha/beta fold hydrolase [Planctomycetota bacterium]REK25556.1 MAG: alpha/beta fold hydrolase [Planctomycetota bacterium]REK31732.1 MAG: alpha/beta fold hydrolase [Planctomycetota bacterium]
MSRPQFSEFRPHPSFRGGHAQTLAGAYLPWRKSVSTPVEHRVALPDEDSLVLHDDCPPEWTPGGPVALLMHGLGGSHRSGYMVRISQRLLERGVRSFRLDLRGSGAGIGLARRPYNAGCSADVFCVLEHLQRLCPGSSISPVGFSLSGNILLKLLGESPASVPACVERAMAVSPPIDLRCCVRELDRFSNRMYNRHFVKLLHNSLESRKRLLPDAPVPQDYRRPRRLYDFDDLYTAPVSGFASAEDYYARCSAAQFLPAIDVPTLILAARDDPLVPVSIFAGCAHSSSVRMHISGGGGHLGFIARRGEDPDRRWMDWRVLDWLSLPTPNLPARASDA